MDIDRQRRAAVKTLELMGYTFEAGELWQPPPGRSSPGLDVVLLARAIEVLECFNFAAGDVRPVGIRDTWELYRKAELLLLHINARQGS